MSLMRYLSLSLLALAACTGAEANSSSPSTPQKAQATTGNADQDLCVAVMTHSRTCTDQYVPALVDARAAADKPAGIKASVAEDRAGTIAKANQEWATDSTDASIAGMCEKLAPHVDDAMRQSATACQAKTDCGEFVACIIPVQAQHWQ